VSGVCLQHKSPLLVVRHVKWGIHQAPGPTKRLGMSHPNVGNHRNPPVGLVQPENYLPVGRQYQRVEVDRQDRIVRGIAPELARPGVEQFDSESITHCLGKSQVIGVEQRKHDA
jgi:hypothetical protein